MDAKELIQLTLEFYKYKIDNNLCTMEELQSVADMLQRNINIMGTAEDFAKFCDTSESNVRSIINRHVVEKPKRRVYYPFLSFIKNISPKLLKKKRER